MSGLTESVVENAALAWLASLGYTVLHLPASPACALHADRQSIASRQAGGPDIAPMCRRPNIPNAQWR